MPLSFPLSQADFLDKLPISSISFECPEVVESSQTAGAEVLTDAIGTRYWQGEVRLGDMQRHEHGPVQVLIDSVRAAGSSFMAFDITQPLPRDDPQGALSLMSSPLIAALPADRRLIRLKSMPAMSLRSGDYLAFSYRSDPVRYALHRVVDETVTPNGAGTTGDFEVLPAIQPGAAVDTPVMLVKPACKAIILPGSVQPGRTNRFIHTGMSFRFMQTLR